ncbi:MAG: acyl-CoA/acyl-ACP dehydrogenase [Actinomycetota bacterium]|nr:acyl-CoA/acyl-ACP dehydrogenase [Actinomycetota bacterium]
MDFAFSPEQDMLRASARDFLADRYPIERVVELAQSDAGWDPASWAQLADLGWLGLSVAADRGGAGMTLLDESVLFEETGGALYPGPFFATIALALPALEAAYGEQPDALDAVVTGTGHATLAWAETDGPVSILDSASVQCAARRDGEQWLLSGTKRFVPDLAAVDTVVVVARSDDGVGLWLVDLRAAASSVVARSTMDTTRRLGDLVLDATPGRLLVAPGQADEVLRATRRRALAALACEAVGVAQRALDLSAAYAGQREQFGRAIGTYQGVSHRIANIYVSLQLARSLAYWAAWAVATGDGQADLACAAAKSAAGEAAVFACENAIQSMGGIGFTWDHPLHRYYKRAQWIEAFEGFGREHRSELAGVLLDA